MPYRIFFNRKGTIMEDKRTFGTKYKVAILVYAALVLALLCAANAEAVNSWLLRILMIFRPVINGLVIAYLCNPIFRFFERYVFSFLHMHKPRRALSLLFAFVTLALIFALVLLLIIPQLTASFVDLAKNFRAYTSAAVAETNALITSVNTLIENLTGRKEFFGLLQEGALRESMSSLLGGQDGTLMDYIQQIDLGGVFTTVSDFFAIITDFIFGIFVSIYLLNSKEKRSAQLRKFRHALLGESLNAHLLRFVNIANDSFGKYLRGKVLASFLVGLIYYVALSILNTPHAILVAAIMTVMNMIPLLGPIIGLIPSIFIILLASPDKALPFLIISILIQQLDINIISPKILGTNLGISPLCVMIAITTMGSLWGLAGMILGVPIFAAILEFTEITVMERLQKKGLPSRLGNYYAPDSIMTPVEQIHSRSTRFLRSYEKRQMRLRKKIRLDGEESLTRKERAIHGIHNFATKIGLKLPESPEAYAQFISEEMSAEAIKKSNEEYNRLYKNDCQSAAEETPGEGNA